MPDTPLLSIAVVIHNQKETVEPTLTSLFELTNISFELFVIDDGSTDGSEEVIYSLLDYYKHERTFFFRHEQPVGRANALNEILNQCNGSLLWAPQTIQEMDEQRLSYFANELANSGFSALVQRQRIPENLEEWFDLITQSEWLTDGRFIWNLSSIPSNNRFFNPFLEHFLGLDLALRVEQNFAVTEETWCASPSITNPDFNHRQEILLTLLRNSGASSSLRKAILSRLKTLQPGQSDHPDNDLLARAKIMKENGRFNDALKLIEKVLDQEAYQPDARQLKIEILEKKRRFVEASELKHETGKSPAVEEAAPAEAAKETEVSIIIPTMGYGKLALEHCLVSISEHCDLNGLELVVIDNASLDDTHDYLDELKEKQFLQCKVITNEKNAGFAASINQGIEAAAGKYYCILHNDVELNSNAIDQLKNLMDKHPEFALLGPTTDKSLNPDQTIVDEEASAEPVITEYIDSFCMMLRADANLKLDEEYEMAFYEDIDLCFQAGTAGYEIGIAKNVFVQHHLGTTTFALGLDTDSEQYWRNVAYFNEKWGINLFSEQELSALSTFDQLLALNELVNPLFPEEKIKQWFEQLFTSELKTEIMKRNHHPETLCNLVHLFMVMDEREVMRRLEDRLENIELPPSLIYQLVRFYYSRSIYSRCIHYLDRLDPQYDTLRADLYRLSIMIENKELEEAVPLLKDVLEHAPANPTLYKLTGDIHKFNGTQNEASSFYDLAEQIDPFHFINEEKDAFGFEL